MNKEGSVIKTEKLFKTSLDKRQEKNSKLNHLEFIEGKSLLKSYPRRVVLELTNRCNFRCVMCGRESAHFKTFDMPLSIVKRFEAIYPYIEEVTLHGWGEGTLHPHFIEILDYYNKFPHLRKYFVTNGSTLPKIQDAIFNYHVDIIAISLDGTTSTTNDSIRKGGKIERELTSIKKIIAEKEKRNCNYPYMNFVFTAMERNIHELPDMVTLTHDIGLTELKVVYLTIFNESLLHESLMDKQEVVKRAFNEAGNRADQLGIKLKLPEIQGEGDAASYLHKQCSFPWRDLYIGSDGFIRPCQSSVEKLCNVIDYESFDQMWNSTKLKTFRRNVNDDSLMSSQCTRCYHSTCANWNLPHSFIQIEQDFAPTWEGRENQENV